MFIQEYQGKTLKALTKITNIFSKPVRVFVLADKDDDIGQQLITSYTVQQVIDQCPALADAVVVRAEMFYGETILRVSYEQKEGEAA